MPDMSTAPTIIQRKPTVAAALAFVAAKRAADEAKRAADEARAALVRSIREDDGRAVSIVTDLGTVTVTDKERRSVLADELVERIPADLFASVTEPKVVLPAFDAAVQAGRISAEDAEAVTIVTPFTDVRVTR